MSVDSVRPRRTPVIQASPTTPPAARTRTSGRISAMHRRLRTGARRAVVLQTFGMHPTRCLIAALACALACALALPATAAAADDPTVPTAVQIDAVVGPDDDTTCTVDGDLYKPTGASADHPVAAILTTNGFGGSKASQATLAKSYVKRGYGVLSYSGLGFGDSDCKIQLDDPDWDGKAASAMIDYLGGGRADNAGHKVDWVIRDIDNHNGGQSANDPRVGMI